MTKYRIFHNPEEYIDIEADKFDASPVGILFTKQVPSLTEVDPLDKTAFCGLFLNIFGFYAIDDDGNRIDLRR
jgi:hypothetical protein